MNSFTTSYRQADGGAARPFIVLCNKMFKAKGDLQPAAIFGNCIRSLSSGFDSHISHD